MIRAGAAVKPITTPGGTCHARALHLRTGSGGIMLLSIDAAPPTPAVMHAIQTAVSDAIALPHPRIMIACSRATAAAANATPDGPALVEAVVQAAAAATVSSRPAQVSLHNGPATLDVLWVLPTGAGNPIAAMAVTADTPSRTEVEEALAARLAGAPLILFTAAGVTRAEEPDETPHADAVLRAETVSLPGGGVASPVHGTSRIGRVMKGIRIGNLRILATPDMLASATRQAVAACVPAPAWVFNSAGADAHAITDPALIVESAVALAAAL